MVTVGNNWRWSSQTTPACVAVSTAPVFWLLLGACSSTPAANTTTTTVPGKAIAPVQFRLVTGLASKCKAETANPAPATAAVLPQVPDSPFPAPGQPHACVRLGPAQFAVTRVASAQVVAFPQTRGDWGLNASITRPEAVTLSPMFTADYHKNFAMVVFGQVQNVATVAVKGPPGIIHGFEIVVASHKLAERIAENGP